MRGNFLQIAFSFYKGPLGIVLTRHLKSFEYLVFDCGRRLVAHFRLHLLDKIWFILLYKLDRRLLPVNSRGQRERKKCDLLVGQLAIAFAAISSSSAPTRRRSHTYPRGSS